MKNSPNVASQARFKYFQQRLNISSTCYWELPFRSLWPAGPQNQLTFAVAEIFFECVWAFCGVDA